MLGLLFTQPYSFVIILGGIILAIGIHEAAHCFMADYLGDPTPRSLGRLTLNPFAHLDPLGTLIIVLTGAFGWGKASPFDPYNLKNPQRDTALIAAAGPVSNLLLASFFAILLRLSPFAFLFPTLEFLIYLNINLAVFNLLPLPPLDGSKIFWRQAPFGTNPQTGYLILILLIATGLVGLIISPISQFIVSFLI